MNDRELLNLKSYLNTRMEELYKKIKHYTLEDALAFEESDRQFLALQKMSDDLDCKLFGSYLLSIILNSVICYQLSWKWEDYWEEFAIYFWKKDLNNINLIDEVSNFIRNSKNNKRFINAKIKRLEKLRSFSERFKWKEEVYYQNMTNLRDDLAKELKQKVDAKTIVFAVKMYGYWARNIFRFEKYPREINIPIDSRLTKLYEKYKWDFDNVDKYYIDLSQKMEIAPLHLDWIVWTLYDELIKEDV